MYKIERVDNLAGSWSASPTSAKFASNWPDLPNSGSTSRNSLDELKPSPVQVLVVWSWPNCLWQDLTNFRRAFQDMAEWLPDFGQIGPNSGEVDRTLRHPKFRRFWPSCVKMSAGLGPSCPIMDRRRPVLTRDPDKMRRFDRPSTKLGPTSTEFAGTTTSGASGSETANPVLRDILPLPSSSGKLELPLEHSESTTATARGGAAKARQNKDASGTSAPEAPEDEVPNSSKCVHPGFLSRSGVKQVACVAVGAGRSRLCMQTWSRGATPSTRGEPSGERPRARRC